MKFYLSLMATLFLCCHNSVLGQSQVVNMGKSMGDVSAYDAIIDNNGNHIFYYRDEGRITMAMTGANYSFKWATDLNVVASGQIGKITLLPNNTYLGFINQDQNFAASHFFCLDSSGVVLWHNRVSNGQVSSIWDTKMMVDGTVGFTGTNGVNPVIGRINDAGTVFWTKTIVSSGGEQLFPRALTETADGGLITFCDVFPPSASSNGQHRLYKYDSSGVLLWERHYSYPGRTKHSSAITDSHGNIYCIGEYTPLQSGVTLSTYDINIEKYDSLGNYLSAKYIGGDYYDGGGDIEFDSEGNILAIGTTLPTDNCFGNLIVVKMNTALDTVFVKTYGNLSSSASFFYDLHRKGNVFYTAGHGGPWSTIGSSDGHLIKTDTDFNLDCHPIEHTVTVSEHAPYTLENQSLTHSNYIITWTPVTGDFPNDIILADACTGELLEIDESLSLGEVVMHPNPTSGPLQIEWGAFTQEKCEITVRDLFGRKVLSKKLNGNAVSIDLSGLSAGAYLIEVTSGNQSVVQRIIVE